MDILCHQFTSIGRFPIARQGLSQFPLEILQGVSGIPRDMIRDQRQVLEQVNGPHLWGRLGDYVPGPDTHGLVYATSSSCATGLEICPMGLWDADRVDVIVGTISLGGRRVGFGGRHGARWSRAEVYGIQLDLSGV